jgi:hypothetical protein
MFVVDIKGKKPELGGLPNGRKAVFWGRMSDENFCIITAPEEFDPNSDDWQKNGPANNLSENNLIGHIGKKSEFSSSPISNGCWIHDRGFAHGQDFAFSYHGPKDSREYSLGGRELTEILIGL